MPPLRVLSRSIIAIACSLTVTPVAQCCELSSLCLGPAVKIFRFYRIWGASGNPERLLVAPVNLLVALDWGPFRRLHCNEGRVDRPSTGDVFPVVLAIDRGVALVAFRGGQHRGAIVVFAIPWAQFSVRAFVSELSLPFINSFKIFKYKTSCLD